MVLYGPVVFWATSRFPAGGLPYVNDGALSVFVFGHIVQLIFSIVIALSIEKCDHPTSPAQQETLLVIKRFDETFTKVFPPPIIGGGRQAPLPPRVGDIYEGRGPGSRVVVTGRSRRDPVHAGDAPVSMGRGSSRTPAGPGTIISEVGKQARVAEAAIIFAEDLRRSREGIPIEKVARPSIGGPVPVAMPPPPQVQIAWCRTVCP